MHHALRLAHKASLRQAIDIGCTSAGAQGQPQAGYRYRLHFGWRTRPASARSDAGRDARTAFLSLKKTCQKLNIKFWDYLLDRIYKKHQIPYLPELILQNSPRPPYLKVEPNFENFIFS